MRCVFPTWLSRTVPLLVLCTGLAVLPTRQDRADLHLQKQQVVRVGGMRTLSARALPGVPGTAGPLPDPVATPVPFLHGILLLDEEGSEPPQCVRCWTPGHPRSPPVIC